MQTPQLDLGGNEKNAGNAKEAGTEAIKHTQHHWRRQAWTLLMTTNLMGILVKTMLPPSAPTWGLQRGGGKRMFTAFPEHMSL